MLAELATGIRNGACSNSSLLLQLVPILVFPWFMLTHVIGPRFALVFLQYFLHSSSKSSLPTVVFLSGIVRTVSCGGWVYVTSTDHHDFHDVMMVLYIVCNVPWMLLGIRATPAARSSVRRKRCAFRFLTELLLTSPQNRSRDCVSVL